MNKNHLHKLDAFFWLGFISIVLSGCESFRNTFGLDHYQPDEFKVSDNPPLSMPKDFKLRPPSGSSNGFKDSMTRGSIATPSEVQAQNLLLGSAASASPPASKAQSEKNLLAIASNQQQAAPNIRETVNREAAVATNVSEALIQRIMGWKEEAARNVASIKGETPSTAAAKGQTASQ